MAAPPARAKRNPWNKLTGLKTQNCRNEENNIGVRCRARCDKAKFAPDGTCDCFAQTIYAGATKDNFDAMHWHFRTAALAGCTGHAACVKKENMKGVGSGKKDPAPAAAAAGGGGGEAGAPRRAIHDLSADWMARRDQEKIEWDLVGVDVVKSRSSFSVVDAPHRVRAHGKLRGMNRNSLSEHVEDLGLELFEIERESMQGKDVVGLLDAGSVLRKKTLHLLLSDETHVSFYAAIKLVPGKTCSDYFKAGDRRPNPANPAVGSDDGFCPWTDCPFETHNAATIESILEHWVYNLDKDGIHMYCLVPDNESTPQAAVLTFQPWLTDADLADESVFPREHIRTGSLAVCKRKGIFAGKCSMHSLNLLMSDLRREIDIIARTCAFCDRVFSYYVEEKAGPGPAYAEKNGFKVERYTTVRMAGYARQYESVYMAKDKIRADENFKATPKNWNELDLGIAIACPGKTAVQRVQIKGVGVEGTLGELDTLHGKLMGLFQARKDKHFEQDVYLCFQGLSNTVAQDELTETLQKKMLAHILLYYRHRAERRGKPVIVAERMEIAVRSSWSSQDRAGSFVQYWERRQCDQPELAEFALSLPKLTMTEAMAEISIGKEKAMCTYWRNGLGDGVTQSMMKVAMDYDYMFHPMEAAAGHSSNSATQEMARAGKTRYVSSLYAEVMGQIAKRFK
eukprot:gene5579-32634_t